MKLEFSGQVFENYIKFHENPPRGSQVVPWGRADGYDEIIVAFRNFANAPKNRQVFLAPSVYKIQFIPHREHGMLLLEGPFG
jgi:hypothetical protein